MSNKSFVSGALILMLAGFIVKILGFVYRIYLSNLIGAEGMGLFGLISPVYSLIILTLTSGTSIAVSKMVAEDLAQNHVINIRRITKCAFVLVMILGIVISVLMLLYAGYISNNILKDSRTYYSLLLLVPSIPVIAAASAIKGYFYGVQEVVPTAISQIIEQIVRISLVMLMAASLLHSGLEYACALATLGMAIGEIANLSVLAVIYKVKKGRLGTQSRKGFKRKSVILKELIKITIPVSFNRFVTSVMAAVEVILIPRRLIAGGLNYQHSLEEFGKLTGMALPLIFFPCLVTASLATTLVPAISEAISIKRFKTVNYRISKSIQITFILGFIFTSIFLCYPDEIGNILYRKENIGRILYLLAFTCIFTYLQQTLLGILNGLGKQAVSLRNSIMGSFIRIGFVYFTVPIYGIKGYVWGIIVSSGFVCILNIYTITKTTGLLIDIGNWIIKPGIVGTIMYFSGKYIYSFFEALLSSPKGSILCTISGNVLIALFLMTLLGALDKDEVLKLFGIKGLQRIEK